MRLFSVLSAILFALTLPSPSKADTVFVEFAPTSFTEDTFGIDPLGGIINGVPTIGYETVAMTFYWNITTETLSDIRVIAEGPWGKDIANTITSVQFDSAGHIHWMGLGAVQYAPANHGDLVPDLSFLPGTYQTDLYFRCTQCIAGDHFKFGQAFVTAVDVPEPGTLALLGLGLVTLTLKRRLWLCL